MSKNKVASATSSNGILGRTARPLSQLWQVPAFLLGIAALAVAAAASAFGPDEADDPVDRDLAVIRHALEKPGIPSEHIVSLAESAAGRASREPGRAGETHFLLGTIHLRLADRKATDVQRRASIEKSAMHLELAELRGVPAADQARLTYLRGKAAYLSGANMERAIELLSKSLPEGADNAAEGYGFIVQAQLRKAVPDLDAALDANLRQLEVCDDETMLTSARLLRGELLLKKDLRVEAIKALEAIGPKAPQEVRLKARYLQAKAAMDEGMWGRAIPWWRELLVGTNASALPAGKGRIYYNLGICCLQHESPAHENEAVAAWREAQLFGGEDAQAAALRLAELRLHSGGNPAEALEFCKEALDKVASSADYQNSLLDLSKARVLLEEACRIFDKQRDNEHFLQAAELYKKLAAPGAAEELIGQAGEARGQDLLLQAQAQPEQGNVWLVQAQDAFQKAALAYEQAADTRPPAERLDAMWRCIECYGFAQKPEQAIAVLKKFVELPAPPERKAEAWFTLAQTQRQLKLADARQSYTQCVAFNVGTFTSRALLELADIAIETKNTADAEAVLLQVKNPPASRVADRASHELALLKLADLYINLEKFDRAVIECKELIKQYPANPRLFGVRESLANCYHEIALQAKTNAESSGATPQMKQRFMQEWSKNLETARDTYQELADDLEATADELKTKTGKGLPAAEEKSLRRALFKVGDCYYELPNFFEEAFRRYTKIFERFRAEPDALWACLRICQCWERAAKAGHTDIDIIHEAAQADVEYCLVHFQEFEQAGAFEKPEHKTQWKEWLEQCQIRLAKTSKRRGG
jgi:tetratricopeptide (TPR) repeat protein